MKNYPEEAHNENSEQNQIPLHVAFAAFKEQVSNTLSTTSGIRFKLSFQEDTLKRFTYILEKIPNISRGELVKRSLLQTARIGEYLSDPDYTFKITNTPIGISATMSIDELIQLPQFSELPSRFHIVKNINHSQQKSITLDLRIDPVVWSSLQETQHFTTACSNNDILRESLTLGLHVLDILYNPDLKLEIEHVRTNETFTLVIDN